MQMQCPWLKQPEKFESVKSRTWDDKTLRKLSPSRKKNKILSNILSQGIYFIF